MPKALHDELAKRAKQLGLKPGSARFQAYVYGTMQRIMQGNDLADALHRAATRYKKRT